MKYWVSFVRKGGGFVGAAVLESDDKLLPTTEEVLALIVPTPDSETRLVASGRLMTEAETRQVAAQIKEVVPPGRQAALEAYLREYGERA